MVSLTASSAVHGLCQSMEILRETERQRDTEGETESNKERDRGIYICNFKSQI